MSSTKIETSAVVEESLTSAESVVTEKPETEATLTSDAFVALVVGLVTSATPSTEGTLTADQDAVNSAYRTVAQSDRPEAKKALATAIRTRFSTLSVGDERGMAIVRGLMEAEANLTAKAPKVATVVDPRPGLVRTYLLMKASLASIESDLGTITESDLSSVTVTDDEIEKFTKAALPKASHTFTGERGSIQAVVDLAFAEVPSGTFLKVSEIVAKGSLAYGEGRKVSSGAVEARLFPASGKVTLTGVTPVDRDGATPRGATKI